VKRHWAVMVAAAAMVAGAGGVRAVPLPGVNQAVIDSETMPSKFSAFGLFHANNPKIPLGSLLYELRTPLFSDYTDKARFISLPPGKKNHCGCRRAAAISGWDSARKKLWLGQC
jgi:hypothetical protein